MIGETIFILVTLTGRPSVEGPGCVVGCLFRARRLCGGGMIAFRDGAR